MIILCAFSQREEPMTFFPKAASLAWAWAICMCISTTHFLFLFSWAFQALTQVILAMTFLEVVLFTN